MSNSRIDGSPIDEQEWLQAAATNPASNELWDSEEDIYTASDGDPFRNKSDMLPSPQVG